METNILGEANSSFDTNQSNPMDNQYDSSSLTPIGQLILSISLLMSGSLSIAGNTVNLLVIYKVKTFKRNMRIYLSTLSIADLATGVFVFISASFILFHKLESGTIFCIISALGLSYSPYLSSLSLSRIAIDKFLLIKYPFKYNKLKKIPFCYSIVDLTVAWIILLWVSHVDGQFFKNITYQPLYGMCLLNFHNRKKSVSIVTAALSGMGVHIGVTVYAYFSVAMTARYQAKRINRTMVPPSDSASKVYVNTWKGFAVFLTVTVAFFVAWLPFWTTHFLLLFTDYYVPVPIYFICGFCTTANSWWNPIIYTLGNGEFRKILLKLLPSLICRKSSQAVAS